MQSSVWVEMLGAEVRYYNANGIRTRCLEAGSGAALIMLHGGNGHAEAWVRNVIPLSERYHCFAIDQLGFGFTDKPLGLRGTPDAVNHIRDFMDAAGIESAHIMGESMGGVNATFTALTYPERVRSVIVNTAAGFHCYAKEAGLGEGYDEAVHVRNRLGVEAVAKPTRESVARRLQVLMYDPSVVPDEIIDVRYRIYSDPVYAESRKGYRGAEQYREEFALTPERLRRLQCPFYIVWTKQNPGSPPALAEAAHRLTPGSRLSLIDRAGHWPQYEQADEYNALILEWLADVEGGRVVAPAMAGRA